MSKPLKTREQLALELRLSEERFRMFMENAPFVAFIKDEAGRMLYYNRRMADRFGISAGEWLGKADRDLWPIELAEALHGNDLDAIASPTPIERLEETIDSQGRKITWKVTKFAWRNELGETLLGGLGHDLTDEIDRQRALSEANLQLQRLAAIDDLTGLANRRILDERVEYEFRLARRHKTPFSVVLLDVDNFKLRNDRFGHAAGDHALALLGGVITGTLRTTDIAARYGGEEFGALLPGADAAGARIFAERLRTHMQECEWPDEPLTASFGLASYSADMESGQGLIGFADRAMYEAKRSGKNRIVDVLDLSLELD